MKIPFTKYEFKPSNLVSRSVHGKRMDEKSSSKATSGNLADGRVLPWVPFDEARKLWMASPRLMNTTEGIILDIINREYHFDGNHKGVKIMEDWDDIARTKKIISMMLRNLMVLGTHIISPIDWQPLQMSKIKAKIRDEFGHTEFYIKEFNGQEEKLPASDFIEVPYIELDREAWSLGMFHSLFFSDYTDIDGRDITPLIKLHVQSLQDTMKIHHKFASPRVLYSVENVNQEVMDNDIIPILESMKPGDRAAFNALIEPKLETIDTSSRFHESVENLNKEVDVGAGTAKNRLITEPSAMADAREANRDDDDRVMGLMQIITQFMERELIPRITGLEPGEVEFKWGTKDSFNLEFPEAIEKAINTKVIPTPQIARQILEEQFRWKFPDGIEQADMPNLPLPNPDQTNNNPIPQESVKALYELLNTMTVKEVQRAQAENR